MLADDVAIALAPSRTYARLVEHLEPISWWRALERPALVLLVIGVASAISSTRRVTATLVTSTMLLWTFVIAVQMVAGLGLVLSSRTHRVSTPSAIDLLFAGHLPWSLWVCLAGGWYAADWPFALVVVGCAAVGALIWTLRIVSTFITIVLGASHRERWVRLLAHQAFTWFAAVAFIAATSGGWWRLLDP
jgi:hypothetical protein